MARRTQVENASHPRLTMTRLGLRRLRPLVVAAVAAGILAGCGSTGPRGTASTASRRGATTSRATKPPAPGTTQGLRSIPTPGPTRIPADPHAVQVIRAWSDALRRGDIAGAARYFALPSLMVNGPDAAGQVAEITIRTHGEAQAANESLPCGAQLISTDQRGRYVNALFRLTDRPGAGGGCGTGIGQTARTNFVISRGRIVDWIRAPDDPGDNAGPPQTTPTSPPGGGSSPSV